MVDRLENDGRGLNLCYEVRMGIVGHTGPEIEQTLEGQIIRIADRIAYINHDIDDAMRAGILNNNDIPSSISSVLGYTHRQRIDTLVQDMIACSMGQNCLQMQPQVSRAMQQLREFMFERVYRNPVAKGEEAKARGIIQQLYRYYERFPERLPEDFLPQLDFDGIQRVICDYIAGMTDKYAIYKYSELFIPNAWQVRG